MTPSLNGNLHRLQTCVNTFVSEARAKAGREESVLPNAKTYLLLVEQEVHSKAIQNSLAALGKKIEVAQQWEMGSSSSPSFNLNQTLQELQDATQEVFNQVMQLSPLSVPMSPPPAPLSPGSQAMQQAMNVQNAEIQDQAVQRAAAIEADRVQTLKTQYPQLILDVLYAFKAMKEGRLGEALKAQLEEFVDWQLPATLMLQPSVLMLTLMFEIIDSVRAGQVKLAEVFIPDQENIDTETLLKVFGELTSQEKEILVAEREADVGSARGEGAEQVRRATAIENEKLLIARIGRENLVKLKGIIGSSAIQRELFEVLISKFVQPFLNANDPKVEIRRISHDLFMANHQYLDLANSLNLEFENEPMPHDNDRYNAELKDLFMRALKFQDAQQAIGILELMVPSNNAGDTIDVAGVAIADALAAGLTIQAGIALAQSCTDAMGKKAIIQRVMTFLYVTVGLEKAQEILLQITDPVVKLHATIWICEEHLLTGDLKRIDPYLDEMVKEVLQHGLPRVEIDQIAKRLVLEYARQGKSAAAQNLIAPQDSPPYFSTALVACAAMEAAANVIYANDRQRAAAFTECAPDPAFGNGVLVQLIQRTCQAELPDADLDAVAMTQVLLGRQGDEVRQQVAQLIGDYLPNSERVNAFLTQLIRSWINRGYIDDAISLIKILYVHGRGMEATKFAASLGHQDKRNDLLVDLLRKTLNKINEESQPQVAVFILRKMFRLIPQLDVLELSESLSSSMHGRSFLTQQVQSWEDPGQKAKLIQLLYLLGGEKNAVILAKRLPDRSKGNELLIFFIEHSFTLINMHGQKKATGRLLQKLFRWGLPLEVAKLVGRLPGMYPGNETIKDFTTVHLNWVIKELLKKQHLSIAVDVFKYYPAGLEDKARCDFIQACLSLKTPEGIEVAERAFDGIENTHLKTQSQRRIVETMDELGEEFSGFRLEKLRIDESASKPGLGLGDGAGRSKKRRAE